MHNLKEVIKRLTQEGTPLGDVLVTEKKTKKRNSRKSTKSTKSHPTALRSTHEPADYYEDGEFTPIKILYFNDTPFEAHFKYHSTVVLTNLDTYESYLTPCLWDSKQMQDFHYHLQSETNWERFQDGDHLDQNYHVTLTKDAEGKYTIQ